MWCTGIVAAFLFCQAAAFGQSVVVSVIDTAHLPVAGARLQLRAGEATVAAAETDENGQATFANLAPAHYTLVASKDGLEQLEHPEIDVDGAGTANVSVIVTMAVMGRHEAVDVEESTAPIDQGATVPTRLPPQAVRELPSRPATVAEALPLVPGVVRKPDGALQISGSAEHRSALIVNSADVTDPATGQFGLTVPIDSVETLNVYQTPYMAEYGRFTAGLVSVETRRGGDKWKWELNDPFPDFYIRSWRLRGLRDATPRLNLEGPLISRKLYFSEGLEYEVRKTEVYTLPWQQQKKKEGVNSFAQVDWVSSESNLLTATVHLAPQRLDNVNLDYFNPAPATPQAGMQNYTATIADHLTIFGGILEATLSATRFDASVWGNGQADLVVTPEGNSGSYFAQQNRVASRISGRPAYSLRPVQFWGTHNFKIGSYLAYSADHGQMNEHTIDILDGQNRLEEQIAFIGGRAYSMDDREYAFFGQDHWNLSSRLAIDLGVRTESQEVSESFRVAPRGGIAWSPFAHRDTVLRLGFGLYYDHVPLNVYSFNHYPREQQTFYGPDGDIVGGPYFFGNALSQVNVKIPFVFKTQGPGNFSPRSTIGSIEVEQPLTAVLKLRLSYVETESDGLVILDRQAPDPTNSTGAFELMGAGESRYRQFEATARLRLAEKRQLFFSYVRSRSSGDQNDFNYFLGSFPGPIIRPNQSGTLPGDLPNRFVAWGLMQLSHGWRIAPVAEYRSGFPYSALDGAQNYVGAANSLRYPGFVALDSRLSKDIRVKQYTVRLSLSGYNLTNHFNPEAVHYNIADPAYGLFFGERHRRFTMDFDVLF
jgi:hypothetical protein